jgi:hypothetical protein
LATLGEEMRCTPLLLMLQTADASRHGQIREAFRREWITLGWMLFEAAVAIGSGILPTALCCLLPGSTASSR